MENNREQVLNDAIEAMTSSIMSLVEVCVRKRITQYVEVLEEKLQEIKSK